MLVQLKCQPPNHGSKLTPKITSSSLNPPSAAECPPESPKPHARGANLETNLVLTSYPHSTTRKKLQRLERIVRSLAIDRINRLKRHNIPRKPFHHTSPRPPTPLARRSNLFPHHRTPEWPRQRNTRMSASNARNANLARKPVSAIEGTSGPLKQALTELVLLGTHMLSSWCRRRRKKGRKGRRRLRRPCQPDHRRRPPDTADCRWTITARMSTNTDEMCTEVERRNRSERKSVRRLSRSSFLRPSISHISDFTVISIVLYLRLES